jgi:hypothetical protein
MDDSQARNRHLAISLLRLGGALAIMFGLVIAAGRLPEVPRIVGIIAVLVGALDFALVPLWLARRWRTPK